MNSSRSGKTLGATAKVLGGAQRGGSRCEQHGLAFFREGRMLVANVDSCYHPNFKEVCAAPKTKEAVI